MNRTKITASLAANLEQKQEHLSASRRALRTSLVSRHILLKEMRASVCFCAPVNHASASENVTQIYQNEVVSKYYHTSNKCWKRE